MSNADTKFICKFEDHPSMKDALEKLIAFQDQAKEKRKFIDQQLKTLSEDKDRHWRVLWDEGVKLGLIDPSLKFDDWGMSLGDKRKQLFIEATEECSIHGKNCPDKGGISGVEIIGQGKGSLIDILRSLTKKDDD